MNHRMAMSLSVLMVLSAPCELAAEGEGLGAADFFVSPRGKDTWSGTVADPGENDGPFATVARARDAVRALPAGKIGFEAWDLSAFGPRRASAAQNAAGGSK